MPALSICISTYNPGENFYKKIVNLLSINDDRFQIVISDNKSTDNIIEKLKELNHPKLKILVLDKNYGPTKNYVNALNNADANYAMFVTDKDSLNTEALSSSIDILLRENPNFGYFKLNSKHKNIKIKNLKSKNKCLEKLAYLSKHPTGYFYKTSLLKTMNIMEKYSETSVVGYFPFEFICAEFATLGKGIIINNNLCETAKAKKDEKIVSKTYSGKNNNLFFDPEHSLDIFLKYYSHCKTLNITHFQRFLILKFLVKNLFYRNLKDYVKLISNDKVAEYYQFNKVVLKNNDIKNIANNLLNTIEKDINISSFDKFFIKIYSIICLNNYLIFK